MISSVLSRFLAVAALLGVLVLTLGVDPFLGGQVTATVCNKHACKRGWFAKLSSSARHQSPSRPTSATAPTPSAALRAGWRRTHFIARSTGPGGLALIGSWARCRRRSAASSAGKLRLVPQAVEGLAQVEAVLDQLHRDPVDPTALARTVDRHDVRVGQATAGAGLPREELQAAFAGAAGREELERHAARQRPLPGLPDLAHAALAQLAHQGVVVDGRARLDHEVVRVGIELQAGGDPGGSVPIDRVLLQQSLHPLQQVDRPGCDAVEEGLALLTLQLARGVEEGLGVEVGGLGLHGSGLVAMGVHLG